MPAPPPPPLPPYTLPTPPIIIDHRSDLADLAALLAAAPVVGMDCEWGADPPGGGRLPSARSRRPPRFAPVETLQLATGEASFVVDLRGLGVHPGPRAGAGAAGPSPSTPPPPLRLSPAEAALDALFAALCSPASGLLVGHSLRGDLARLAATLGRLPVFGGGGGAGGSRPAPLAGHVDLVLLARVVADAPPGGSSEPGGPAPIAARRPLSAYWPTPSLQKLAARHLGAHLDKVTRRSDWAARPLSAAQVAYAAADAAVCVDLFHALEAGRGWEEGTGGDAPSPRLAASPRWLAFLANGVTDAAGGRGGGSLPARPASGHGSRVSKRERNRRWAEAAGEAAALAAASDAAAGRPPGGPHPPRPPPARECAFDVPSFLDAWLGRPLPTGGRAPILAAVAGLLPPGLADPALITAALRASPGAPRGGVIETASACLVLVNFQDGAGGASRPRLYTNRFSRDAGDASLLLSWWPPPGQGQGSLLAGRLLGPGTPVLLFARLTGTARRGGKGAYVALGRLTPARVDWEAAGGGGEVSWRLVDEAGVRARGGAWVAAIFEAGGGA